MADQKPLVIINGQIQQIPSGDTISSTIAPGTGGAAAFGILKSQSTDQTLLTNYSIIFPNEYFITGTAGLTLAGNSIFRLI